MAYRFYPLAYSSEIKTSANQYTLEQSQVAGIVYEESKFDPDVVSSKDAIGLMQILPDTANVLARELGISNLTRDQLFLPSLNLRFGCYYFRQLLNKYNNNLDLALAAYNAGFGAVDKANQDISSLPKETQDFIKRTKLTQRIYITLYPDELKVSSQEFEKNKLNFWELISAVFNKIPNKSRK